MSAVTESRVRHDALTRIANWAAGIAIVLIMVGTCTDVTLRAVANSGIAGVVESSEILLVATVFLGLAMMQAEGRNVATHIVVDRLGPRTRRALAIGTTIVSLLFTTSLAWSAVDRAIESIASGEYRFGLVPVPLWPGRTAMAIGSVLLALQLVRQLVRLLRHPGAHEASDDAKAVHL